MRLILHVGTEKTGTTVIQNWLYENETVLRANGFLLMHCLGSPNNRKLGAYFQARFDDFFLDHNIADEAARLAFFEGFESEFDAELQASAAQEHGLPHSCIISSEHLSSRLTTADEVRQLAHFLRARFEEIEVVCYFRDQESLRRSLYSTALISGYNTAPDDFMSDVGEGHYYFNYEAICDNWQENFNPDRFSAVVYSRDAFLGGDVRKDFAMRLGLPVDTMTFTEQVANESLSPVQMYLLRLLNSVRGRYLEDGAIDTERQALVSAIANNANLRFGGKYDTTEVQINSRFEASNLRFAQKFLAQSDSPWPAIGTIGEEGPERRVVHRLMSSLEEALPLLITLYQSAGVSASSRVLGLLRLQDEQVDILRDVALLAESGGSISVEQAVELMRMAAAGRPDGPVIQDFLQRHARPNSEAPIAGS